MNRSISSEDTQEGLRRYVPGTRPRLMSLLRKMVGRQISLRTLLCLALLAVVVVLFYWKTLLTNQFTLIIGSEGVNTTYAWLHFWVRSIRDGQVPLWDPYTFAGSPFAATLQPSTFYPLQLLFAVFPLTRDGLVSPHLYHVYLALAHFLCACLTFALLRELNRGRFAALTGACVFSLGGLLARTISPPYIESCIWLPGVFLFLLRAIRQGRRDRAVMESALGGACLAMSILAGGLVFVVMQGIFALTAAGHDSASLQSTPFHDRRSRWSRMALILTVFFGVAAGLGAVALFPASEYSRLSLRFIDGGMFPSAQSIPYHSLPSGMWPQNVVSALFPNGFRGNVAGEAGFPLYIGVFPLLLAVVAIWRSWRNVWVRFLTRLAVFAFAYSLAEFSPLYGVLYAVVPFLWLARPANQFLYLTSFALAVLCAFGADALLDSVYRGTSWAPATRLLKWIAIVSATALLVPGIFSQLHLDSWNALSLLLILASCGWFIRLTKNPSTKWLRLAVAAFILFDLSAFNWQEVSKAELSKSGDQLDQMVSLRGAAEFVKARPGLNRVRVAVQPEPNVGDVYGIQSVSGGSSTVLTSYAQLGSRDDLLNVRYYIKPASIHDPGAVYQDSRWKVYENSNAYPRAWLVHQAIVQPSHEAGFRQLDEQGTNLHKLAVIETPLPAALEPSAGTDEPVRFRSYEANRMQMEVNARSAGLLVLSEIYYPGWIATVNGKDARIYQVDGALRGIVVSGGLNRIELKYAPSSFRAGAALSLLTLVSVVVVCLLVLARLLREREMQLQVTFARTQIRRHW